MKARLLGLRVENRAGQDSPESAVACKTSPPAPFLFCFAAPRDWAPSGASFSPLPLAASSLRFPEFLLSLWFSQKASGTETANNTLETVLEHSVLQLLTLLLPQAGRMSIAIVDGAQGSELHRGLCHQGRQQPGPASWATCVTSWVGSCEVGGTCMAR